MKKSKTITSVIIMALCSGCGFKVRLYRSVSSSQGFQAVFRHDSLSAEKICGSKSMMSHFYNTSAFICGIIEADAKEAGGGGGYNDK